MDVAIMAFLQNPWFPPSVSDHHRTMYINNDDFRRRALALSVTGKRLLKAYGTELYYKMLWQNASTQVADNPSKIFPADIDHMSRVIEIAKPSLIIAFGKQAQVGIRQLEGRDELNGIKIFECCHPCYRQPETMGRLKQVAREIRKELCHDGC